MALAFYFLVRQDGPGSFYTFKTFLLVRQFGTWTPPIHINSEYICAKVSFASAQSLFMGPWPEVDLLGWTSREIERVKPGKYVQNAFIFLWKRGKFWKFWPNSPKESRLDMKKLIEWRQRCKEIRCPKVLRNFGLRNSRHVIWGPGALQIRLEKSAAYNWSSRVVIRWCQSCSVKSCIAPKVILICWFYSARLVCFVGFVIFVDFLMGVPRTSHQIGGVLFGFSQQLGGLDGGTMFFYRIHTREYKRYILYTIHRFERYCSVVEVIKSVLVVLHQVHLATRNSCEGVSC